MGHGSNRASTSIVLATFGLLIVVGRPAWSQEKPGTKAAAPPATFSLPDDRLGMRVAPLLLLTRPDIGVELGLSPEQKAGALAKVAEIERSASALVGRTGPAIVAARKQIDDSQWRWLQANLLEHQQVRLEQIDLQWEGPSAIVRPIVARSLELTPEQLRVIGTAVKKVRDARAARKLTLADEIELNRTALGALTPAQQERWGNMRGPQFRPRLASVKASEKTKDKDATPASR